MRLQLRPNNRAFSLVELSIVLVILGLLVGGVLSGQALIRAAELRKTMNYVNETRTAWMTFKDKYFALPGDMPNATTFWGRSNVATDWHNSGTCPTQPGTVSATGTCNGNGNGYMTYSTAGLEQWAVWEHLKLAGLIGYAVNDQIAYTTKPPGLRKGTVGAIINNDCCGGGFLPFMSHFGTALPDSVPARGIGIRLATYGSPFNDVIGGIISPEEMWRMDTKMDDGLPGSGLTYGFNGTNGTAGVWYTTCLNASGSSYVYNVSETSSVCQGLFALEQR